MNRRQQRAAMHAVSAAYYAKAAVAAPSSALRAQCAYDALCQLAAAAARMVPGRYRRWHVTGRSMA